MNMLAQAQPIGFGFTHPFGVYPAGCFILGVGLATSMPATNALISIVKQKQAAAAGGALHSCLFMMAGVFVLVSGRWPHLDTPGMLDRHYS